MNREDKIKFGKLRGGRPSRKFKDKKKYRRKKKHRNKENVKTELEYN